MTASERFAQLVRLPTVSSHSPEEEDSSVFDRFPALLAETYPSAHAEMERELVGDRCIVYIWRGSDPSLKPALGLAHYDVVPPGDPETWDRPAFSGEISEDRIYGRGTLDDKGMLAAWMEAVNRLAATGFQPERTLYLAFGGDEETTGIRGGGKASTLFAERGLSFAFILDEGGAVTVDQLEAFTSRPIAMIGSAEKGYLTLKLRSTGMPGHASSPPKYSAVGRLSAALAAIEKNPHPARLTEMPIGMLKALGAAIGGLKGTLLSHPRLFKSLILRQLAESPTMGSLVRTTQALTVVKGGDRDNVMPESAEANVNIRLLPGESVASATTRIERTVSKAVDGSVSVEAVDGSVFEPVDSSPISGPAWDLLKNQARRHWPDVIVAPYLMTGTTDSRWYRNLSDAIYRFIPMEVSAQDMKGVHGPNESISLEAWGKSVDFMEGIMRNMQSGGTE